MPRPISLTQRREDKKIRGKETDSRTNGRFQCAKQLPVMSGMSWLAANGFELDQIPSVSVKILECRDNAIVLVAWFLAEKDALAHIGEIVSGKVVSFKEQEYSTSALIPNCPALTVVSSPRKQEA